MDEMAQFKTENGKPPKLTCIFDHNMIINTPIGPNISPLRCPNILRDYFYRSETEELQLSLGFYTSDKKRTMVNETWNDFKTDVNSNEIRDLFKLRVSIFYRILFSKRKLQTFISLLHLMP